MESCRGHGRIRFLNYIAAHAVVDFLHGEHHTGGAEGPAYAATLQDAADLPENGKESGLMILNSCDDMFGSTGSEKKAS